MVYPVANNKTTGTLVALLALGISVVACSPAETISDENNPTTAKTPVAAANKAVVIPTAVPPGFLPGLSLLSVTPNWGPIAGGTPLTLSGTGFFGSLKIDVGGKECKSLQIISDSKVTCITSEGTVGSFAVKILKENEVAVLTDAFIYSTTPTVDAVNPASGYVNGNTPVTILGANFAPGVTVKFGDFACNNLTLISNSILQCKTPTVSKVEAVDVKVKNIDGSEGKLGAGFQFLTPPTAPVNSGGGSSDVIVSGVVPAEGLLAGGTAVSIVGSNFSAAATVTFGGQTCTDIVIPSATLIRCTTPAGTRARPVPILVDNGNGTSGFLQGAFTYLAPANLTSVTPNHGPVAGGTSLILKGSSFRAGAAVRLGSVVCSNVETLDSETIRCTTPVGSPGTMNVSVTNADLSGSSLAAAFTYDATPTVLSISPASVSQSGGSWLAISGTGFLNGASVLVGSDACASTIVVNATLIQCIAPPSATTGARDIKVINSDGQNGTRTGILTYSAIPASAPSAPIVSAVSPIQGPPAGGTLITITGQNFSAGDSITVGSSVCTGVTLLSATSIRCNTPAHVAGVAPIIVSHSDGTASTIFIDFLYSYPPEMRSIHPNLLSIAGGETLTIEGDHFMSGTTVTIGGSTCGAISVLSASQIRCTSPALAAGNKNLVVTNSDSQNVTFTNAVTYRSVSPTVTNLSPYSGPTVGGTHLTITGTNFVSGAAVTLNDRSCTSANVTSATNINCNAPALPGGTWATLRVTNPDGLNATLSEAFLYNEAPALYGVLPVIGPTAGSTSITISGTGFLAGSTLTVGGNACTGLQILSPNLIRCSTAAHAAGATDIVFTASDGQSATLTGAFRFENAPTLTSVTPSQGSLVGGNAVLFAGTGFKSGLVLKIGGNLCTSISYQSETSAACVVPTGVAVAQVNAEIRNSDGQSATLNNAYRYTPPALSLTCSAINGDYNAVLASKPCTESNPETGTLSWSIFGCSGVSINAVTGNLTGNLPATACTATVTVTNTNVALGIHESIARTLTISPYISLAWGGTATLNEQCLLTAPGVTTLTGGATWNAAAGSVISKATVTTGTSTGLSGILTDFNLGSFSATWTSQSVGPVSAALPITKNLQLTTDVPPYVKSTTTNVTDYLGSKVPGMESNRQGCGSLCDRQTYGHLSVGGQHACALSDDGIKCWGRGDLGQVGQNAATTVSTPTSVYTEAANSNYISNISSVGMTAISGSFVDTVEVTSFCALLSDKSVACWGYNGWGQLGDGTITNHWTPKRVLNLTNITRVAAGNGSFCALKSDGTIWCWGYNGDGLVGDGTVVNKSTPARVAGISNATDVDVNSNTSCAVANGKVYCWGTNDYGQLGDGTTNTSLEPLQIPGITTAIQVRTGASSACALLTDGSIKCWGRGDYGQLGNGSGVSSNIPVTVIGASIANIVELSSGVITYYARNAAGNVWGWGYNTNGEIGDGTGVNRTSAVRTVVIGVTIPASKLRGGRQDACAIADAANNYALYCWGYQGSSAGAYSSIGLNGIGSVATPTVVAGMSNSRDVLTNYFGSGGHNYGFGMLLKRDNSLWQWGWHAEGAHSGVPIVGRHSANVQVAAGRNHNCALLSNGRVRCWGANADGQLGDGTQANSTVPVRISADAITSAISVAAGAHHSCALMSTTQKIKCWGKNSNGQIGDVTTTIRLVPTDVSLGADLGLLVAAGGEHTCALTQNAGNYRTKCWGLNNSGQLGTGDNSLATAPQVVLKASDSNPLTDGILMLTAGNDHTCALLSDNTVMCWGNNAYGQLGDGTTVNNNKAVVVSGLSNIVSISAGFSHTCALTKNMQVYCWGSNIDGSLGDGTTTARSIPILVNDTAGNPLSRVLSVEAGDHVTCAMVEGANDTANMKCWGNGTWGQMGNSTTTMSNLNPATVNALSGTEWVHQRGCRSYVVTSP